MAEHGLGKTGALVHHRDDQRIVAAADFQPHPVRRRLQGVVEHVMHGLFERGIGDDRPVLAEQVAVFEVVHRAGGAPLRHQLVDEGVHGGLLRGFAAGLAGGQQNTADDGFAAQHLGLHFADLLGQIRVGLEHRHAPPVAQDHRQGGQRRAQFVGGAGGQQAHAHDVLFLGGALAQGRQTRVPVAPVAGNAVDKDHQQHRVEHEAQQHALDIEAQRAQFVVERQRQRPGGELQSHETAGGDQQNDPGGPGLQQHRRQHHLQQVEENKGVGGAAAEIELHGERDHVHQQGDEQLAVTDRPPQPQAQQAGAVERHQPGQHREHIQQRQLDPEHEEDHQDGAHLTEHGDPAQLDQLLHVLAPGGVVVHRRGRAGRNHRGSPDRRGRNSSRAA